MKVVGEGIVPTPPGYSVEGCTWRPSMRQNISRVIRLTCSASLYTAPSKGLKARMRSAMVR